MCVCECVCVCICIYVCVCVYIYIFIYIYISVAVLDLKNWGGEGKYGANQNNVRTFFLLLITVILYNIYELHCFQ